MPFNNGTPERIRTSDPRYRKPILYPAELRAHKFIFNVSVAAVEARYVPHLTTQFLGKFFDHF